MNMSNWAAPPLGYSTVETLLDEVSSNMAASNISRQSRGSIGQKTASMRVVKPSSASNSPRNSVRLGRRMTDGAYRRRLAMLEQGTRDAAFTSNNNLLQSQQQTTRPVSWHPASHIPQTAYPYSQQFQAIDASYLPYEYQQNSIVYSAINSPSSSFSPALGPFPTYEQPQYVPQNRHSYHPSSYSNQQAMAIPPQPLPLPQQTSNNTDPTMYSHFDWENFAVNGFENSSTTPPTPENFLPIQHPEPTFQGEDAIPYQSLDDSDDGEELIGMGLYDAPEIKSPPSDPHLDNYRTLMMSQLLGTPYRRPESTGKGLKLEETWAPPPSNDEEDSEEDGDGEEEGEDGDNGMTIKQNSVNHSFVVVNQTGAQDYSRDGWL